MCIWGNQGMAFATALALFTLFVGSALALMLSDNQFAQDFHWAVPWLCVLAGISASVCLASARWFGNLFLSSKLITEEATKQTIHNSAIGGDVRMAGRDYHEAHKVPNVKEPTVWYEQGRPSYEIYKETPASHGPGNPIPIRPPAGIRISHAYGLDVSGNDIDMGQAGLSSIAPDRPYGEFGN